MTHSERQAKKLVAMCRDTDWARFPKGHWRREQRAKELWAAKRDTFGKYIRGIPFYATISH